MSPTVEYETSSYRRGLALPPRLLLEADPAAAPRLNVVLPHLFSDLAFGGVTSALELAAAVSRHFGEVRFLSQSPLEGGTLFDLREYAHSGARVEVGEIGEEPLRCHGREIFLCTYWTSVLAWEVYADLLRAAGRGPNPFYYLIQDFEPGFYPYGYKHARCLSTYGHGEWCHAVFNSEELAAHFSDLGYRFSGTTVARPSLNEDLRSFLEKRDFTLPAKDRDLTAILVYGRPEQARNCFSAILEGLYQFFSRLPEEERRRFVTISAGQPHDDVFLMEGALVKSAGKLPIDRYIHYLCYAQLGVSLMVSPHPSYPPLEMATFGCYTVTNDFGSKNLAHVHPNLHPLGVPSPENIARELTRGVAWFRRQPEHPIRVTLPSNMSPLSWRENASRLEIPALRPSC